MRHREKFTDDVPETKELVNREQNDRGKIHLKNPEPSKKLSLKLKNSELFDDLL